MAKAKLNFRRLSVTEKIAKARQIVTLVGENAVFAHPVPPLATITTATDDLAASDTDAEERKQSWRHSVDLRTQKEDVLTQLVSQCQSYVESVAGADESIISSAGMDPRGVRGPSTMPAPPSGLEVTIGDHDGELDLSWDPVDGAKSYLIEKSLDPNNATGSTHGGSSTKSSTAIGGLTSGTRYWFRTAALNAAGQSGWSDPATKIAP